MRKLSVPAYAWLILLVFMFVLPSHASLVVYSATVSGNQITITGTGLAGSPVAVELNGQLLTIVSDSPKQIVATMNPLPPPGTYLLSVKSGASTASAYVALSNIVATFSWLNQNEPIPVTVLFTPTADHLYRVSIYMVQTPPYPASGSCSQGYCGVVFPTFEWTDDGGVQSEMMVSNPAQNQATAIQYYLVDSSACPTANSIVCPELMQPWDGGYGTNATGQPDAELIVRAKAGTPISFSTYYAILPESPQPTYDTFLTLEQLM